MPTSGAEPALATAARRRRTSPGERLPDMTLRIDLTNDRRRELRERMALKAQATPWIPTQEGDELAGTVAAREFITLLRREDRKSTRLNSSHLVISYAVFCL